MRSIQRFATVRALASVILATVAWTMAAGVAAFIAAQALHTPVRSLLPQSLGMLTATACLLVVMWRWGWLRAAGVTALGSRRLWQVTAGLTVYVVLAYHAAFFGGIGLKISSSWGSSGAQSILLHQAVVGVAEEFLFRGFLLLMLVHAWGDSRRGLLAAVTVPALIFGLAHATQALGGTPMDDTLMTMLNCFVSGLWWGALVLVGGSIWPAVLIHAASNASVQIAAATLAGFDPTVAGYAMATAAELPLVITGLWLLVRKGPGLIPVKCREWTAKASPSASAITGLLLLLSLTGTLFLGGCAGKAASNPTPHPPAVIEAGLTAAERAGILDAAWQTVNDKFFDPTFGGKDWQAIGDEYRQKLATVQDDKAFWLEVLNPMLFELGVSHLGALPAEFANELDPISFSTGSLGMEVRLLDGVTVITRVVAGSPAAEAGLRPGFVVTAVDGQTPGEIAAEGLHPPPYNDRRQRAGAVLSLHAKLYGEPGTEVVIDYLDAKDRPQRATLELAPRDGLSCGETQPGLPPVCAEFHVERLSDGVAYLRFSGFLGPVLDGVLQAIDEVRDVPALIIDLRGNPGGEFPVRKAIASQLVGEPKVFLHYQLRTGAETVYLDAVPDAYPGQVVILVDELSASSSEEFTGSLQALGRATIIGTQTQGNCLVMNIELLPGNAILFYPYKQARTSNGRILEDNGVVPDIEVGLDRQQLLQGVDAQLKAALAYLDQAAADPSQKP